jgi:hypothetical protein
LTRRLGSRHHVFAICLELDDPPQLRQSLEVLVAAQRRGHPREITDRGDQRLHPVTEVLLARATAQVDESLRSARR